MIERRAIPKIGSFVDIVVSYDYQEFRRNFRLSRGKYTIPLIFENSHSVYKTLVRQKCNRNQ
jgi:hypothetical protein